LLAKLLNSLRPFGDEEKISTAEHTETAECFLQKDQKDESFYEYFILSASSRISAGFGSFLLLGNQSIFSPDPARRKTGG
jgi:hypothetical protein